MKKYFKYILMIIVISFIVSSTAHGAAMTKKEAIDKLSASEMVRKKISDMLDFKAGYDSSKISRFSTAPVIRYIRAVPLKAPPDNRTVVSFITSVDDPAGLNNISRVKADLSSIGKPADMILVDNGLWGDEKGSDGIFTLQTAIAAGSERGEKKIQVEVANRGGWLTLGQVDLIVNKDPAILEAKAEPWELVPGASTLISVRVENPGGINEIDKVLVDLRQAEGPDTAFLRNDGKEGDLKAGDNIYSLRLTIPPNTPIGKKIIPVTVLNRVGGTAKSTVLLMVK
ncbi:MAG: hypothetical protein V1843_01980 [bacterium]